MNVKLLEKQINKISFLLLSNISVWDKYLQLKGFSNTERRKYDILIRISPKKWQIVNGNA